MTMVDDAATKEAQQSPTVRWGIPRPSSRGRDGGFGGIMLSGAGLVATLVVVSLLWWASAQRGQAEVPNLVGMPRAQAEALLTGMGLKVRAAYDETSTQPVGTVLRTDPPAGQALDQGGGVSLTLASAPTTVAPSSAVATPPVQEAPVVQAAPPAQQPQPAAPPRVDVVPPAVVVPPPVVVSPPVVVPPPVVVQPLPPPPPPPALRPVPEVAGFDMYRAQRTLADNGLRVGSVIEVESTQPPRTVLGTNPRAGVAVRPDSSVDLFVAKRAQVVVPSVVGLNRAKAEQMLTKTGLRVGSVTEIESNQPSATVLRTNPKAGTEVSPGSTVDLVIAKPPTTSTPPTTPPASKPPAPSKSSNESADVKGRETRTNGGNK